MVVRRVLVGSGCCQANWGPSSMWVRRFAGAGHGNWVMDGVVLLGSICLWWVVLHDAWGGYCWHGFLGWFWRGGGMGHVKGSAAHGARFGMRAPRLARAWDACSRRGMKGVRQKCEQRAAPKARRAVRRRRTADGRFGEGWAKYAQPFESHTQGAQAPCSLPSGNKKVAPRATVFLFPGGSGEIRTHERLSPSAVFKTAAFNHSATLPDPRIIPKLND